MINPIFIFLWIFHILIWAFVLLAFLNEKTAYYNLYFVVPFIYIIHILPLHILEKLKEQIYTDESERKDNQDTISKILVIPYLFQQLNNFFSKSFCNPLSPQGMLIFGMITCAYKLKKDNF